jgi:flagellar biosynthesis chaperone FliJ
MLIRISLIVAIIAGLAVGALNFLKVKEKITILQADLQRETEGRQRAETDLAKTRKDLAATTAELKTTKETLESTTQERDTAVAELDKRSKEVENLTENLKRVTGERDTAQEEVARYRATGMTPEQILAANKTIKDLQTALNGTQGENRVLLQEKKKLEIELARYKTPDFKVPLPAALRGKILAADPKWNFVVLDIGENQGVLEYGEMLVNRNGKLVGKIVVRTVQKDRSVANVMPGWEIGEVIEGDQVIPAHPAS